MSQSDRFAKAAASKIKRVWLESHARNGALPRSPIAAAEGALRARRRRRVILRWTGPLVAASLAVGGGIGGWTWLARRAPPTPVVTADTRALMLFGAVGGSGSARVAPRPLASGDQVFAPRTTAVALGDVAGTQLTVEAGGSVTVLDAGDQRRLSLRRGALRARVRKLTAGERFIVETADTEIEVHGTAFRIELGTATAVPCAGPGPSESIATRVSVSEGVVSVKWAGEEQRLHAGEAWPPVCAPVPREVPAMPPPQDETRAAPPIQAARRRAPAASDAPDRRVTHRHKNAAASPAAVAVNASVLEAQNDLFQAGVRARRAGRAQEALTLFDRYLERYPDGSLYEHALAQKLRLLAAGADGRSADAAARTYLGRFPDGFARDEARAQLAATHRP